MRNASMSLRARLILAASVLLLAAPAARAHAQEDEGGGDIDSMMQSDPDRPAKAEEEGEGEAAGDEQAGGEEKASGEQGSDDERAFREMPDESKHKKKDEEEVAPPDPGAKGLGIGVLLGYGISLESGANIWSAGFGLQGNYDTGVFVIGARFVYYIGSSADRQIRSDFQGITRTESVTANLWELSVDLGFDIDLSPAVTLRPGLGIGFASVAVGNTSNVFGAFSPGAALLYDVSPSFYIGLDARLQIVTATQTAKGLVFLGAIGLRV
jgi:hypothetical protein